MGTVQWEGAARTAFAHLSQGGLLKPTGLLDLLSPTMNDFWPAAVGSTGADYLEATEVRSLLMQLSIERAAHPVADDHDLALDMVTTLGYMPGSGGKPPRYGGVDRVQVRSADDINGPVHATWTAWWLWFRIGPRGIEVLHDPAPKVLVDQDDALDPPLPVPRMDTADVASRFRWSSRETDMNNHVFFLSYPQRAENALADAGIDTSALHRWRAWFVRPSFLHEAMTAEVARDGDGWMVALRNDARDEVAAYVRGE